MRYSLIRKMDITNGEGLGVALFVQGCHFHCKGCFNPETWDFNGGKKWDEKAQKVFFNLIKRSFVKRVSILGGEPLESQNIKEVCDLIYSIKKFFPNKKIWLYTGFTLILNTEHRAYFSVKPDISSSKYYRIAAINQCDYIVDGQFELSKQDLFNEQIVFAGSTNQRVIDVQESLRQKELILKEGVINEN